MEEIRSRWYMHVQRQPTYLKVRQVAIRVKCAQDKLNSGPSITSRKTLCRVNLV